VFARQTRTDRPNPPIPRSSSRSRLLGLPIPFSSQLRCSSSAYTVYLYRRSSRTRFVSSYIRSDFKNKTRAYRRYLFRHVSSSGFVRRVRTCASIIVVEVVNRKGKKGRFVGSSNEVRSRRPIFKSYVRNIYIYTRGKVASGNGIRWRDVFEIQ